MLTALDLPVKIARNSSLKEEYDAMSRTEYLFGCLPDEFPEQESFARRRIKKAKLLKSKLSAVSIRGMSVDDIDVLQDRYGEVDDAQKWAHKLLQDAIELK